LLFMAPACLNDPGVTIVVVPYRALLDNLLKTAKHARIDCIEYRPGEQNPAALVFVSEVPRDDQVRRGHSQLLQVRLQSEALRHRSRRMREVSVAERRRSDS
jgi:hypothetical protein